MRGPATPYRALRRRAGCLSVRNRNLMVLARSKLRLASLTIGNTTTNILGKPRITNQARPRCLWV
jgi:hypothetical protein